MDVPQLVEAARQAYRAWWEAEDDDADEDVHAVGELIALSQATRASPEVDLPAAGQTVDAGLALLHSDDPVDRRFGVRLLREMELREEEIAHAILSLLRRDQDPTVVRTCVGGLYFRGCREAIPDLTALLDHPDADFRYTLAGAISTCAGDRYGERPSPQMPEAALTALLQLAADADADVRYSALYELSSWWQAAGLRDPRVETALRTGLTDEDEGVREACVEALDPPEGPREP